MEPIQAPSEDTTTPSSYARLKARIWDADLSEMTQIRRLLTLSARIGIKVGSDVWDGQLTLRAMSLVYTTLLSLVPLLAISFSVLKGFGVHREIEPFLIAFLAPLGDKAEEIAMRFVEFIDNTSVSVLGYVGFAMLFYAVISMLQKIERAFNFVWRVQRNRSLPERLRDYLTLIVIGPTLMFAAAGLWATIMGTNLVETMTGVAPLGLLLDAITRILPVLLVIVAFTFVNAFVPNTKVLWRPALVGGIISGVLWNIGGVGFAAFVGSSANYPTIYSGFATAIFFMIWLYLAWMILLIGGSISFYIQNPHFASFRALDLSIRMREKLAFAVAAAVGRRFYLGEPPHTSESIAQQLGLPAPTVESVLDPMEAAHLLIRAGTEGKAFVPHHAWDTLPLKALVACIRTEGESEQFPAFALKDSKALSLWERFDGQLANSLDDTCLRDLIEYPLHAPSASLQSSEKTRQS